MSAQSRHAEVAPGSSRGGRLPSVDHLEEAHQPSSVNSDWWAWHACPCAQSISMIPAGLAEHHGVRVLVVIGRARQVARRSPVEVERTIRSNSVRLAR